MITKNTDLRHVVTGVKLSRIERMEAQLRHMVASNHAQRQQRKAENARRGLSPRVAIGSAHVPPAVARAFAYIKVA
ncbi:hypothetical protein [Cupriavidus sp. IK-TO18]|uniref:hypothetical protein n=1 Tax=Cupriavidus sp. IK-TO18 TaxID=2782182 RepID=UPI001899F7E4|nr:hypothetical protein [Cupriavidus sp. IK-TO18]MBF6987216.1 hypothetical protein [Cupriavidus sp. IK-TO18]